MKWKLLAFLACYQPIYIFCFQPIAFIETNKSSPTLINSVSFHPKKNLFCTTFTHHQRVGIYQIMDDDSVKLIQELRNPDAQFSHPQNAIFSPDGNNLLIVNWSTRNFNVYPTNPKKRRFQTYPQCVIPCQLLDENYRPHGMCFSANGSYLAVVYGSFEESPWIVILYRVYNLSSDQAQLIPCCSLQNGKNLKGVPKGISFSPDGASLIITFTETNSIGVFFVDLETGWIDPEPKQEISGAATQLCRPEDIAFSPDGTYCAVSNSSQDTVTFYKFDKVNNRFFTDIPFKIINKKNIDLHFPHGLGFSSNGKYFAITQFGLVQIDSMGYITTWSTQRVEGIFLFKVR